MSAGPVLPGEPAPTVLVVDDDHRVREVLEIAFTNHGYRVLTAGDGDEALTRAAEHQPDLVILDIRLPRKSGLEVCEALRAESGDASMAIILVSAAIESELRLQGFHRGADDYLTKPFSPRELVARARRLIKRSRELGRARLKVTELEHELRRSWEESKRARDEARRAVHQSEALDEAREAFARAAGIEVLGRSLLQRVRSEADARAALLLVRSDAGLAPAATFGVECGTRDLRVLEGGPLEDALMAAARPVTARFLDALPTVRHEITSFEVAGFEFFVPVCHEGRLEALIALAGGPGMNEPERATRMTALGNLAGSALAAHRERRERALDLVRLLADGARSRGYGGAHFEAAHAAERGAQHDGLPAPGPALAGLAVEMQGTFTEQGGRESLARLAALDSTGVVAQIEALALGLPNEAAADIEAARPFVALGARIAELIAAGIDPENATLTATIEATGFEGTRPGLLGAR